jgi:tRNA-2-methylthio-N6-dimethylallyladenosine synthase
MDDPHPHRRIFIESFGCQMNLYDSEIITSILEQNGYDFTPRIDEADCILVNTCSVREHAEKRALARIAQLTSLRDENPEIVIGVVGCMAQRRGRSLFDEIPGIDFIMGPDAYERIAGVLDSVLVGKNASVSDTRLDRSVTYGDIPPERRKGVRAWIAISRGCDNFCSYCIVPYVRGRLRSRSFDGILREARAAVSSGYREIILLGQNVNAYRHEGYDFVALLEALSGLDGLARLRFTTSHPKAMTAGVLDVMASLDNVCPHLHLPLQSGSDRILTSMNRGYDVHHYLDIVDAARSKIHGISITTDILVGFPGETEDDHRRTLDVMRESAFDNAFTFMYSPREGTVAANLEDDVPQAVKRERLQEVISLQRELSVRANEKEVGTVHRVLLERQSKKRADEVFGRTMSFKGVVLKRKGLEIGDEVTVVIDEAHRNTLRGNVL